MISPSAPLLAIRVDRMTNTELVNSMRELVHEERMVTNKILHLICLAEERKLYLEMAYPSLFEWLVKEFSYSEASAQRRIQAARFLRDLPEVAEKLEQGTVNLSTLGKAQSAIRNTEKIRKVKLSIEEKKLALFVIEGKSALEAEKALISLFPETRSATHEERKTVISAETMRLAINFSQAAMADLERAKDLLSHITRGYAETITYMTKDFLKRRDPLRISATAKRRSKNVTPASFSYRDHCP